jgi:DNA-directed RNA polymerase subunit M/transcription elongation factor TFIIS
MKCKDCGSTMESPKASRDAFGDGEPDQYTYYVFCSKCGHEDHLDSELSHKEKEEAVKRSQRVW